MEKNYSYHMLRIYILLAVSVISCHSNNETVAGNSQNDYIIYLDSVQSFERLKRSVLIMSKAKPCPYSEMFTLSDGKDLYYSTRLYIEGCDTLIGRISQSDRFFVPVLGNSFLFNHNIYPLDSLFVPFEYLSNADSVFSRKAIFLYQSNMDDTISMSGVMDGIKNYIYRTDITQDSLIKLVFYYPDRPGIPQISK